MSYLSIPLLSCALIFLLVFTLLLMISADLFHKISSKPIPLKLKGYKNMDSPLGMFSPYSTANEDEIIHVCLSNCQTQLPLDERLLLAGLLHQATSRSSNLKFHLQDGLVDVKSDEFFIREHLATVFSDDMNASDLFFPTKCDLMIDGTEFSCIAQRKDPISKVYSIKTFIRQYYSSNLKQFANQIMAAVKLECPEEKIEWLDKLSAKDLENLKLLPGQCCILFDEREKASPEKRVYNIEHFMSKKIRDLNNFQKLFLKLQVFGEFRNAAAVNGGQVQRRGDAIELAFLSLLHEVETAKWGNDNDRLSCVESRLKEILLPGGGGKPRNECERLFLLSEVF